MDVVFQGGGLPIPAALADHARRRLHFVLTHHSELVQSVVVRFGGISRRRGNNAMSCLMHVRMVDSRAASAVDIGADIHYVIDRATDRVGRMVVEHLEQTRHGRLRVGARADTAPAQDSRFVSRARRSVTALCERSR